MTLLSSKELLDGTKNPETTTGEFRLAMGNIRDFLFGLSGDDSPDKWLVRETLETAEKFIAGARGTGDALTGKFTPTVRELVHGMTVMLRAHATNTTGAPTLKADETPALPIVKGDKRALDAGDIAGKGHWLELKYDRIWNKRVLQNPAKGVSLKEEIDDKADKPELLDYLPLSGASMSGVLSVTSGLNVAPQDMTGLTGEGGETVLKGAGYDQNIHPGNIAGQWRIAGSVNDNTLVFDPSSGEVLLRHACHVEKGIRVEKGVFDIISDGSVQADCCTVTASSSALISAVNPESFTGGYCPPAPDRVRVVTTSGFLVQPVGSAGVNVVVNQ